MYLMNDIGNLAGGAVSITPQTLTSAATTSGRAVDCQSLDGSVNGLLEFGDCGDASATLTAKLQEGDDTTTFTDVTNGAFTGLAASATANDYTRQWVSAKRTKRYVRISITVAAGGGTPSIPVSGSIIGRKKITGSGGGTQTT